LAYYALRPELYFDAVADVKPTRQSHPGASVVFTIVSDMPVASAPINESVDVDAVALSDSTVTATLNEYGAVAKSTKKLRATSYLPVDPVLIDCVSFNAGVSIDSVVRDVLKAGSNVRYAGNATARNTVTPADHFGTGSGASGASLIRRAVAELRGANVPTIGGAYVGFVHPDVSYDLRGANGGANWRDPHTYSAPENIFNGEIGMFEGVRFVETPRAPVFVDAGSSTTNTDVYGTLILGRQALAKAWSMADGGQPMPTVAPTPIVDNLRRFLGAGWYHLVAYTIFRQPALRRIESASSIGAN
jgi:N4-gp56 family major capsid protein